MMHDKEKHKMQSEKVTTAAADVPPEESSGKLKSKQM